MSNQTKPVLSASFMKMAKRARNSVPVIVVVTEAPLIATEGMITFQKLKEDRNEYFVSVRQMLLAVYNKGYVVVVVTDHLVLDLLINMRPHVGYMLVLADVVPEDSEAVTERSASMNMLRSAIEDRISAEELQLLPDAFAAITASGLREDPQSDDEISEALKLMASQTDGGGDETSAPADEEMDKSNLRIIGD